MRLIPSPKKFVFVHIPKTAGESISSAIRRVSVETRIDNLPTTTLSGESIDSLIYSQHRLGKLLVAARIIDPPKHLLTIKKHSRAADYLAILSEHAWAEVLSFSVVRNPWDRAVSFYHHLRKPMREMDSSANARSIPDSRLLNPFDACRAAMDSSFEQWINRAFRENEFGTEGLLAPQQSWLVDSRGTPIVKKILRFETLTDDWKRFCGESDLVTALPHRNESNRNADYRKYYSSDLRALIEARFADDIREFAYTF